VKYSIVADVSAVPDNGFGSRTLLWWGVVGFISIESTAFLLAAGAYFFLMNQTTPWPPNHAPPELLAGTVLTILMLISEAPNILAKRAAVTQQAGAVRASLIVMSIVGLVLIAIRSAEFSALQVRWDQDAYGSILWALLFIHTFHLITDVADTLVLTVFAYVHGLTPPRFSDVADNSLYWHFVVVAWLPLYVLIYWVPRLQS
jgi:cytochrome c oxidase subunit III